MPVQVQVWDRYEHTPTRLGTAGFVKRLYSVGYKWYRARPLSLRGGGNRIVYKFLKQSSLRSARFPTSPEPTRAASKQPFPATKQKKETAFRTVSCAVGESRTHTPQRALPPQSSVSTISPLPRRLGLQRYGKKPKLQIIFRLSCVWSCSTCRRLRSRCRR